MTEVNTGLVAVVQPTFHFYVNNVLEWRTGTDLIALMKAMNRQKKTYWIWYVPLEEDSEYDIKWYAPQVKGAFVLQVVEYKGGKRVSK